MAASTRHGTITSKMTGVPPLKTGIGDSPVQRDTNVDTKIEKLKSHRGTIIAAIVAATLLALVAPAMAVHLFFSVSVEISEQDTYSIGSLLLVDLDSSGENESVTVDGVAEFDNAMNSYRYYNITIDSDNWLIDPTTMSINHNANTSDTPVQNTIYKTHTLYSWAITDLNTDGGVEIAVRRSPPQPYPEPSYPEYDIFTYDGDLHYLGSINDGKMFYNILTKMLYSRYSRGGPETDYATDQLQLSS